MSEFKVSIARNVQYSRDGVANEAAIVVNVNPVTLVVFNQMGGQYVVSDATEYVYSFDSRKLHQPNTYRLNWQGR
jgi:hypothetical protein